MQHIRIWYVVQLLLNITVSVVVNTANVCQYMQCTEDDTKLTLQFNVTMWEAFSEQPNAAFNIGSWNWSTLDPLVQKNRTSEVVFNGFDFPHIDSLQGHQSVTALNLDNNQITTVEEEAFANFKNLVSLSLRRNMITIVRDYVDSPNMLQYLDLSYNWIEDIKGLRTFMLPHLTYLNLSHNRIASVQSELSKLKALDILDLSHNAIKKDGKPFILPKNLSQLLLSHNELTTWPFAYVPETLTVLSLSFNQIDFTQEATSVRSLDLSSNRLASFCSECFPAVEELDLSGNYFEAFPQFSNRTSTVRKISFNRMPNLRIIKRSDFTEIEEHLHELEVSFCPRLSTIESNAFIDLKELKRLDLSFNVLQQVPENMINWNRLEHGVDLQGNPINCNCSMQWLVDRVIPAMHARRELHKLFPKLRCAQPPMYKDYLIVHLTLHENLLCRKYREMDLPGMETVVQSMKEHRQMQVVRAQKIILVFLIIGIVALSCYLAYLKLTIPRHTVRPLYYQ
ncbi:leucine-rich repeat neuronal protein 1-like [Anopheles funestus]|uniref:leucine-rich repeat neuronal protein 1-like n=1 Tax=Anopheles funestus TaxID=62324 RepID=UPI0020C640C4|nr:leucine-rich repeat neuronal protein 1-like [Anopheles funestus]